MFAMALVASNALAVVRGALRQAHGPDAEAEVSGYYLADEVAASFRALTMYAPAEDWTGWQTLRPRDCVRLLAAIARQVKLAALTRSRRGPGTWIMPSSRRRSRTPRPRSRTSWKRST